MTTDTIKQKFIKGDLVHVAKDLGSMMSHFQADVDAIVMYSYNDEHGGGEPRMHQYGIHIKHYGQTAWYEESQLTLIEHGRLDLLKKWEEEELAETTMKGDIDWIFKNGPGVLDNAHGASCATLGRCLGITNMWGSRGEGYTLYMNCLMVLDAARPFLKSGDKEGWLKFCERRTSE